MSSVLCLSRLVAVLLFVGRYCSAFSSRPLAPGVRMSRYEMQHTEITEEPPLSLEGVAGSSLELPCDIKAPTPDDSVVRVLWFKDGAMTPFYTLDTIRRKLNRARHIIDFHLKDRAHLSIDRQPAILKFNLLKEEDEGEYTCRVEFRKARTRYFDLILTVVEPPQSLVGVAGFSFRLPCDITAPTPDDSFILVLWYKDGVVEPFYALDANSETLNAAKHMTVDHLNGRVYMYTNHRPFALRLKVLLEEDEGHYRCRVVFRKAPTRNVDLILTVIVPPKKPVIMDENGEIVHNVIIPDKNGGVYLICETVGGKPTPSLTWWDENMLLDDSYGVTDEGVVRNEIVINARQPNVLWGNFTCLASNNNLTSPVYTTVTVNLNYSASVPSSDEIKRNLNESTSIKLDIVNEIAPITWKYGYQEVEKALFYIGRARSDVDSVYRVEDSRTDGIRALGKFERNFYHGEDAVYRDRLINAPSSPCPLCECPELKDRSSEEISDVSVLSKS